MRWLFRRIAFSSALILYLAAAAPVIHGQAAKSVTAVRFWSFSDTTRIAIEVTGEFEFRSDRALNPDRLFFDILNSRSRVSRRGQRTISVGDRLLKQIRVAETRPNVTRVVFDLEVDVDYTASQLSNPDRLIVELRPAGKQHQPAPLTSTLTGVVKLTEPASEIPQAPHIAMSGGPPPTVPLKLETAPPPKTTETSSGVPQPGEPARTKQSQVARSSAEKAQKVAENETLSLTGPAHTPKAAKLPKDREGSLTRVLGLKVSRIVIDAGHGGHDTGTEGPTGLLEKDLVLDVAQRLGALVESRMGSDVVYTRSDDTFVPLETRTQIANERKADLFVSIHANSSPIRSSSGVETYYLNFTTSKSALEVAARENAGSQKSVHELKDLLQKIALRDKVDESREFAAKVQKALYTFSVRQNAKSRDRGVKKAPFVVLIGAQMPSILAEVGFLTNPRDEALMKRADHRQKLADALFKGISQYAATLSSFQVAQK